MCVWRRRWSVWLKQLLNVRRGLLVSVPDSDLSARRLLLGSDATQGRCDGSGEMARARSELAGGSVRRSGGGGERRE